VCKLNFSNASVLQQGSLYRDCYFSMWVISYRENCHV